jgi:hypothetical protein
MRIRRDHILTFEGFLHGLAFLLLAVVALQSYRWAHQPLGPAPLTNPPVQVVPATGAEGYPIEAFACDPATTVRISIPPPDSTFAVTYDLDRRVGGVHEATTVSVYANGAAVGRHYDSNNVPSDGNVTERALKCIREKAK